MISRRTFLGRASAATVYATTLGRSTFGHALPLNLPLGIQLYSVREQLAKDYQGTLDQLGKLGFREVEAAGFQQRSAAEVKAALSKAGLRCVSSHHPFGDLQKRFDEILAFNKELGLEYMICSSPGPKNPTPGSHSMTLDDWHWISEEFNRMGEKTAAAGIHFGYHNHFHEFAEIEGVVPYLELLKRTDPAKVTMELDCGWAVVGGHPPVKLMQDYPHRFSMLHVKDFKIEGPTLPDGHVPKVTELGQGSIDYRPIFQQAAKTQKLRHIFVEQEAYDKPYLDTLKTDADYVRGIKA